VEGDDGSVCHAIGFPNRDLNFDLLNTGCGRNCELIINKNKILLRVICTNFNTSQFTMVLRCFLHSFTFCVQFL
jgi:hypothetical protein